jgi:hypothetical protein
LLQNLLTGRLRLTSLTQWIAGVHGRVEQRLLQGEIHEKIPGKRDDSSDDCQSNNEDYEIFQGIGLLNFSHKI